MNTAAFQSEAIRIAVIEDDDRLRSHFCKVIASAPDMHVAASASTLAEGMELFSKRGEVTDVLLVDLGLPDGSGLDLIAAARKHWPSCEVMVCTSFSDETTVIGAIEAGASGYLLKELPPERIVEEIRSLKNGGSPISPVIARQILQRLRPQAQPDIPPPETATDGRPLSERETQVLEYITRGHTYDEIAALMEISRYTVQSFVRRIYSKLSVNSKIEAVNAARKQGLVA